MTPPTATITLRPTLPVRLTLIIPGVAISAIFIAYFRWTAPTIVAGLAALALIGWTVWGCTIRLTVMDDTLSLVAPLWSREIPLGGITSVQVIPDDGLNHGWVNWIVTTSRSGVRINAGGTAAVVVSTVAETYTIVCPTVAQARLCAKLFDA